VKIAIVEDNLRDAELLKKHIEKYCAESGMGLNLECYGSGRDLLDRLSENYDIVFLDIELPGLDGISVARRIRKVDKTLLLIFVTNFGQYAINGYEVEALDYLLKPIRYDSFYLRMNRAVSILNRSESSYLSIAVPYGHVRVAVNNIFYVEIFGHSLVFHTASGEIETRGRLSDYEAVLQGYGFRRGNKSCIINRRYVERLDGRTITVRGKEIVLSRNRLQDFTDKKEGQA